MIRHRARGAGSDVVVGVDGSSASVRALRWALGVALPRGWSVEVVTAWPHDTPVFLHDVPGHYSDARERARLAQQQVVSAAVADTRAGSGAGAGAGGGQAGAVRVSTTLENARPERLLTERAHASRLLVLGATGSHGLPERCRELGTCPIAVIGPETHEPEVLAPLLAPVQG